MTITVHKDDLIDLIEDLVVKGLKFHAIAEEPGSDIFIITLTGGY